MKGNETSLKHLQRALTMELTTVNTYLYQARQLDDWGIGRLAERMMEEVDEERGHAEAYLNRILFLEGTADVQTLDDIEKPTSVKQIFEVQHRMEKEAISTYAKAAVECQQAGDVGSFELFMRILKDEEEHIDFVEDQLDLMEMMGHQLYIARQVPNLAKAEDDDDA